MHKDLGSEAGLQEGTERSGLGLPFQPSDSFLQVAWPQSLSPSLPWMFCGNGCMKRYGRPGAR